MELNGRIIKSMRNEIDWEKGEKLYRIGQLSAAEIGKQIGCSTSTVTRHMKSRNVHQDKAAEVLRRTQEAIATQRKDLQRNVAEVTEEDIDEAVNANVALVMSHRKDLQRLTEIEDKLLKELEENPTKLYIAQYQGTIVKEVIGLTVSEKASTLLSLSNVRAKRIEKQREAFGISTESGSSSTSLDDIVAAIDGATKGLPNG